MHLKKIVFILFLFLVHIIPQEIFSQSYTPKPDNIPGYNYIEYNSVTNTYVFYLNFVPVYSFNVTSNGSLTNLKAYDSIGRTFWPSNYGGPTAELNGITKYPWDSGVYFDLIGHQFLSYDTVLVQYQMNFNGDYFRYNYKFAITGRTLTIKIDAANYPVNMYKGNGVDLDRCENAISAAVVRVPYLTLFNILSSNSMYTSMFFDWERTNASSLDPKTPEEFDVIFNGIPQMQSKRFTNVAFYNKKTNNNRNLLSETIYLTTSTDIINVLPNIYTNSSPTYNTYKTQAAQRTVLSYGPPYNWLLTPPECSSYTIASINSSHSINLSPDPSIGRYDTHVTGNALFGVDRYKLLHLLNNIGIHGLAVIAKTYQRSGPDEGYPNVLPANIFDGCIVNNPSNNTTNSQLQLLSNEVKNMGYGFALHENYVDAYPNDPLSGFLPDHSSLGTDGVPRTNWLNNNHHLSIVISPDAASYYVNIYSQMIKNVINPNWSYLDVHSAINPSLVINYDYQKNGAGLFKYVLRQYRSLPDTISKKYNGPVQGEGGDKPSFLYVGYFHDLEARLHTADYKIYGAKAPLFVDFDLYKMHGKSAFHGVGHYESFYATSPGTLLGRGYMTKDEVQTYIAYELAFGHSGLVTKHDISDHTIYQADLEYHHVYPIQELITNSNPSKIEYFRGDDLSLPRSASQYIQAYPDSYWDITSPTQNFMSHVKITYNNNIIIYVNASPDFEWNINELVGMTGRFFFNITTDGTTGNPGVENTARSIPYRLPKRKGWLVYVPTSLLPQLQTRINSNEGKPQLLASTELPFKYDINNYPNPFNPITTIKYQLPKEGIVTIKIFDILGQEVTTLVNEKKDVGYYRLEFNASNLASGTYICTIKVNDFIKSQKMLLIK